MRKSKKVRERERERERVRERVREREREREREGEREGERERERESVSVCEASGQPSTIRCRANMAHVSQSRPHSGLCFQINVLQRFQVVPASLGTGTSAQKRLTIWQSLQG